MSLYLLQGAVEEGFIYAFVALGLFLSYRILNIADLTTDGSFALGGIVSAILTVSGHPVLSLGAAVMAGMTAGMITAILQTLLKVPSVLAGIITMTGLYSINLMILGGAPNLYFPRVDTIFTLAAQFLGDRYVKLIVLAAITVAISVIMVFFLSTQLGLSIRATGDNRAMVSASSINPGVTTTVGLCLANGCTALAGALLAQSTTQADINIGTGTVVIGLASLVLGGIAFRKGRIRSGVAGAVLGAVVYRLVLTVALRTTTNAGYLKLVSAVIVTLVIGWPAAQEFVKERLRRKKESV